MKQYFICLIFATLTACTGNSQIKTMGTIERYDASLDKIISSTAKAEIIAEGFEWSEGPLWIEKHKMLLFSDVPKNIIYKWTAEKGKEIYLTPSGYTESSPRGGEMGSNGLLLDKDGKLVLCQHGNRQMARMNSDLNNPTASFTTIAGTYSGKRFNSPNDVVEKSNGDIYFTDPPYGLPKKDKDPSRETGIFGVYRVDKNGVTTLLINDLTRPNGLAFSPDESILYVNVSDPEKAHIMAYPVLKNGILGKGKLFFDATPMLKQGMQGLPDGLRLDTKGNLFATGPSGVLVISPKGKLLGRIETTQLTANCAWGDDGSTLYMTAHGFLCRIKTKTKGVGF